MINNEPLDELDEMIQLVKEAETDNFFELAKILGTNPKTDLAGANLPNCDLSGGDLEGANLRKMNLSSAKFRKTRLGGADLSYSDISGADFTGADLTGTNFDEVRAENAIFCNNTGLYERIRLNLLEQGAIFREKPNTEETAELRKRANEIALNELLQSESEFKQYENRYVAFFSGRIIAAEEDQGKADKKVRSWLSENPDYNRSDILETPITQEIRNPVDYV